MIKKFPNNCFCKEICALCKRTFDCDLDYYYVDDVFGMVCYECGKKNYGWNVS